ncbi:MAG: bifunctional phosphopantothenoylcysteine decarboxylase/phosphopantothenate--cysteine ligase CoaBC [Gammaproteobacteria bacterium]
MHYLTGKHILLGVTGGIAAYKSAELVRRLREQGAAVRVIMTASATAFITPLTLQALSGQPVHTDMLDPAAEAAMGHIELARWADVLLVAPATADFVARLAHGRADDLLAAVCLATQAPVAVAPAMNHVMWENPATRANMVTLGERGIHSFGPAQGDQACGETGPGRMLEPAALVTATAGLLQTGALAGRRVLVTAGPTREPIDPVRYISNRSSGRMGYAVADAAAAAGAAVTLISGPASLAVPAGVRYVATETAADMFTAVMAAISGVDIFISVAAVADYRPARVAAGKLKKSAEHMTLELQRNPDILAAVAALPDAPYTVGFAAETAAIADNARQKLQAKQVNMIAANLVGDGRGFEVEENALQVYWEGGSKTLARTGKARLARQLVELIAEHYQAASSREKIIRLNAKDST